MAQDVGPLLTARWFKPLTFKNPWHFGLVTFPTFEWKGHVNSRAWITWWTSMDRHFFLVGVVLSCRCFCFGEPRPPKIGSSTNSGCHKMGEGGWKFRGSISGPTIYTSESSYWKMIRNRWLEGLFLVAVLGFAIHFSNGLVSFHHFTTSEFVVASLRSRVPRWLRQAVRAFSEM